jgi:hypothetical protein
MWMFYLTKQSWRADYIVADDRSSNSPFYDGRCGVLAWFSWKSGQTRALFNTQKKDCRMLSKHVSFIVDQKGNRRAARVPIDISMS